MEVYNYDPISGVYLGRSVADESPLGPASPLYPLHSTTEPPPAAGEHEVAVYVDSGWVLQPDWREVPLYSIDDGRLLTNIEIGQTPADIGATSIPCPAPSHTWNGTSWEVDGERSAAYIASLREGRWAGIKVERDRRVNTGGYKVEGKWFHSDLISRTQQLGLVLGTIPVGLQWKTMDGSFVEMSSTLAQQILAAAGASDQAIFAAAEVHRAAMEASDDPANYDYTSGWPVVYEEDI